MKYIQKIYLSSDNGKFEVEGQIRKQERPCDSLLQ